jgi:hypothetical protein
VLKSFKNNSAACEKNFRLWDKNHAPFKLNRQSRSVFGLLKAPELQRLSVTVEVLRVRVMIVGVMTVEVLSVGGFLWLVCFCDSRHIFLKIQDSKNTWPTFSSYQVVSYMYLPLHQMRTELGLLKIPVLPATNTAGALQQFQTEIASLAFGRNFAFFSPLDCCLCSPCLYMYIKGQDWICFFVVVVIFLHFFIDSAQDTCTHT